MIGHRENVIMYILLRESDDACDIMNVHALAHTFLHNHECMYLISIALRVKPLIPSTESEATALCQCVHHTCAPFL